MKQKPALYAVTLNPALDLSGHVNRILLNEKNSVHAARLDPGGSAINAARMAKRIGVRPVLFGFSGGATGEQLNALLAAEEIEHRLIPIHGMTRINMTVTNDTDHQQTRLTLPGPAIRASELQTLLEKLAATAREGILILGGSRPPGCPLKFYKDLVRLSEEKGLGLVVDVPARELKVVIRAGLKQLLLIKPNLLEFQELLGKKLRSESEVASEAVRLSSEIAMVCVSLAERGAIVAVNGRAWTVRPPRVNERGTVGTGDSMVGAMAARLAIGGLTTFSRIRDAKLDVISDVIRWGVAAGAATAQSEGTSLGTLPVIRKLRPRAVLSNRGTICPLRRC